MLQEYQQSARHDTRGCGEKEERRKEGGNTYICEMAEPCSPAEAVSQRKVKIGQSCVITPNPEAWRNQWLERITVNKARKRRN